MTIKFPNQAHAATPVNRSIEKGYIPVLTDGLFESLGQVSALLDKIGVPYIITGGTLLGAVRQGDLIEGDSDWDMEILDTSVEVLLANRNLFEQQGLKIVYPLRQDVPSLKKGGLPLLDCERRIVKIYDLEDNFFGDLFVQTLFSDGILRRIHIENKAYFNSKMSFPAWFFENRQSIEIRGQSFSCPAEPELMVERIYGPRWKSPMKRHAKIRGYNFAGAYVNPDMEKGMKLALERGWVPHYPQAPRWPTPIEFTSSPVSANWIARHEHLETIPEDFLLLEGLTLEQHNARLVLFYRMKITAMKKKALRTNKIAWVYKIYRLFKRVFGIGNA